jgi:hypothetical protein
MRRPPGARDARRQLGAAFDDLHAGLEQVGAVEPREPRDLGLLGRDQLRQSKARGADGPAEAGGVLELIANRLA